MKKKTLYFICTVLLICCMSVTMTACNNGTEEVQNVPELKPHSEGAIYSYGSFEASHEKAILFLPGLMASAMYSNDKAHTNTWGYSFFFSAVGNLLSTAANKSLTQEEKQAAFNKLISTIACDEDGVPETIQCIANMEDDACYDAFDGMSYSYKVLEPYYNQTHDLIVWQYDWRQSITGAAEELESFINHYGYKSVCFVSHSLGGLVVANYLARSEENRSKTQLFVPFAAPFFGSYDAVTYLLDTEHDDNYKAPSLDDYDVNAILGELLSGSDPSVNPIEFGSAIVNNMMGTEFALTDITRNMASIYQTLPCPSAYMNTPYYTTSSSDYVGTTSPYENNGTFITTNEGMISFLEGYSWTHRQDGELKPAVYSLSDYYDALFIDNGKGEKVYVTELVNTEYIVGINCTTTVGVKLNAKGQIIGTIESNLGDYTIPAYSASAGLPLDHERVHTVDKSHNYIANDTADHPASETGIQFLLDIFTRNVAR